jgi:hypothetical protein
MITKKGDGSQVKEKESTDSSTTLEDEDLKGKSIKIYSFYFSFFYLSLLSDLISKAFSMKIH